MKLTPHSDVTDIPLVGEQTAVKLKKLGIYKAHDLLHHVPSRYQDYREEGEIGKVTVGQTVTLRATVVEIKNIYTKNGKVVQDALLTDGEHNIHAIWFRQVYLPKTLPSGTFAAFTGKVSFWGRQKALFAPQFEKIEDNKELIHTGRIVPIYPETAGVTSKWLRRVVHNTLSNIEIPEFLPENLINEEHLAGFSESLHFIHKPEDLSQAEKGRHRLAFNELLLLQLAQKERAHAWKGGNVTKKLKVTTDLMLQFLENLPFSATKSQIRSMKELAQDLGDTTPMNRLLEGDVGSGKTAVAAFGCFVSMINKASAIVMAPTQILAQQHANTLAALLSPFDIPVVLVTSREKVKQLKEKAVYVGTQALLFKFINADVGFVVIDEQHRFGVVQRAELMEKGKRIPHVLTMTATPIPRTVALTLYGDLDLSTLDELPSGRKPIKTWVVPAKKRNSAYEWIEKEIEKTHCQAFVVCPLIEVSEVEKMKQVKAATEEFQKLKTIFKKRRLALLHGKMKAEEKKKILDSFRAHEIDILVTTPVVEVGVDIPNAAIMVIEAADRFGLAALHQLRGRVGRGTLSSYCLLMTENGSEKVQKRLSAMSKTLSGRALAELDLELRGPGEIFGTRQSGIPELSIARWTDIDLIKRTKSLAATISENPNDYASIYEYFHMRKKVSN